MNTDNLYADLRSVRLPAFVDHANTLAMRAQKEGWGYCDYLQHLVDLERQQRAQRRLVKRQQKSKLPPSKTLASLQLERFSPDVRRQISKLAEGDFINEATNVLAFGLPGRGKTHVVCAIGHELIQNGYTVLFVPTYKLVQRLLQAKQGLTLERELQTLDWYDAIILDDIGYVQQEREEMEVLFTFLAERYERKSVLLTSNLVFNEWGRIFKDPMTTAAAIDRLVHHSVILELQGTSYRTASHDAADHNLKSEEIVVVGAQL